METKLTLEMDQSVIQSAKIYAELHNSSVFRLIEDYLRSLIIDTISNKHYSPLVEELSGVINEVDTRDLSYAASSKKYE
jgi:hypothetical protein